MTKANDNNSSCEDGLSLDNRVENSLEASFLERVGSQLSFQGRVGLPYSENTVCFLMSRYFFE